MSVTSFLLVYVLPDPEHSITARALLVIGYATAAWLWWRAGQRAGRTEDAFWWRLGAAFLILLTVNKLFDVRHLAEVGLRAIANAGNWYERRKPVQFFLAIVLPSVVGVLSAIFVAAKGRSFFRRHLPALAGWILLLGYLALRQSQEWKPAITWLDRIGYRDWRLALEVGGIALVVFSATLRPSSH